MKALSLNQPWAELVASGRKTIETRVWDTKLRGSFYVHASKTRTPETDYQIDLLLGADYPVNWGKLIAVATLHDTKFYGTYREFIEDEPFHLVNLSPRQFTPRYGFLLRDIKRLETPIPVRGMLNFFPVRP
jgi:ASC-1-like (ASCH) protein